MLVESNAAWMHFVALNDDFGPAGTDETEKVSQKVFSTQKPRARKLSPSEGSTPPQLNSTRPRRRSKALGGA